jgi:hypothetical protein
MTPPDNTARNLALALDTFLAERRGCWRLHPLLLSVNRTK